MTSAHKIQVPAPASAEARATKVDRVKYLEYWTMENPLSTIEAAREAVREKFKISLGTKIISDSLRAAKAAWEAKRKEALLVNPQAVVSLHGGSLFIPTQDPRSLILRLTDEMRAAGIRLLEILPDGIRVDYFKQTPPA